VNAIRVAVDEATATVVFTASSVAVQIDLPLVEPL